MTNTDYSALNRLIGRYGAIELARAITARLIDTTDKVPLSQRTGRLANIYYLTAVVDAMAFQQQPLFTQSPVVVIPAA